VDWDHEKHTVITAEKTLKKIVVRDKPSAVELEQLVGRLLFASGVSRTPLAPYYFALKWAKRYSSKLNAGTIHPHDVVPIKAGILKLLKRWSAAVRQPRLILKRPQLKHAYTLYTDASDKGWGAVLINDDTSAVSVTGAAWSPSEAKTDISVRELSAVSLAVTNFCEKLRAAKTIALRIDNTSVLSCVIRGIPRAEGLVAKTAEVANSLKLLDGAVTASYVKSKSNLADEPSRGAPVRDVDRHQQQEGKALRYARRGKV
jgi:hypothetical protein